MKELLVGILQSKHTSAAGIIVLFCAIGSIWLPQFSEKFRLTREFAEAYGFVMGGDAIRKGVKSGQTELLSKDEASKQ